MTLFVQSYGVPMTCTDLLRPLAKRSPRHGVVGSANSQRSRLEILKANQRGIGNAPAIRREDGRAIRAAASLPSRRVVRAANKLENEREESVFSDETSSSSVEKGGVTEKIEAELGRYFGGTLWFSVLILSLAVFGGGYVYLILNYADFRDIPILRGPQG